jgi:hypothetical protein
LGTQQPGGKFEKNSLTRAAFAEDNLRFAGKHSERDAAKYFSFVEGNADVLEAD